MRLFSLQRSYDALATGIEPLEHKVTALWPWLGIGSSFYLYREDASSELISPNEPIFQREFSWHGSSYRGMQLRSASYAWPESGFSWRDAFPVLVSNGTELCR